VAVLKLAMSFYEPILIFYGFIFGVWNEKSILTLMFEPLVFSEKPYVSRVIIVVIGNLM
jgi:hypothetical protein